MGEMLAEERGEEVGWTDRLCREFLSVYEIGRQMQAEKGGKAYLDFMKAQAGAIPPEVIEYIWRANIKIPLPAGELARHFPGKRPWVAGAVRIVNTNSKNR